MQITAVDSGSVCRIHLHAGGEEVATHDANLLTEKHCCSCNPSGHCVYQRVLQNSAFRSHIWLSFCSHIDWTDSYDLSQTAYALTSGPLYGAALGVSGDTIERRIEVDNPRPPPLAFQRTLDSAETIPRLPSLRPSDPSPHLPRPPKP